MEPDPPAPEPATKPKRKVRSAPRPSLVKPPSERVERDATGSVQATSFRLPKEVFTQLHELLLEHEDRTGHPTTSTNILIALIRTEHKKRCRSAT